jgi:ComF family protein
MTLLDGLLELLAPTRCAGCDVPGTLLCDACARELPRIDPEHACRRCGAPDGRRNCAECSGRTLAFAGARCVGVFAHPLSRLVVLFKDGGERRLAPVLGGLVAEAQGDVSPRPDAVVGIPASPAAIARRGFDHGALLAAATASALGVPALEALTSLTRADQRRLGRDERAANLRAGFTPRPGVEPPARVLLVDDVFTTGATLDAAARVLLAAGCEEVRVAAVARACEW